MVSSAVADQINRILSGRPPNPNKTTLNQAIDFINENPSLRRIAEGGLPVGLTEERAEAFIKQEQELAGLSSAEKERLQALGQIARAGAEPLTAEVEPTLTELHFGVSLPEDIRNLSVAEAGRFLETGTVAQTFEQRVVEEFKVAGQREPVRVFGFFDVDTGRRATVEQEAQLSKQVQAGRELVVGEPRGRVEEFFEPLLFQSGVLFDEIRTFPTTPFEKEAGKIISEGVSGGLGIVTLPFVTVTKPISESLQEVELGEGRIATITETTLGGIGTIIPTTPVETAFVIGTGGVLSRLPAVARIGAGVGFGTVGTAGALSPDLTPEERVGAGIIGGLGFAGATFEFLPFIKGGFARFSPEFRAVKTQPEGFKAVGTGEEAIGLILPKAPLKTGFTSDVQLPKTSPLVRGGFGVRESEKALFLGREQRLTTSQIGFFKVGKEIRLEREFFVTPQEPTLKIAETRISRLGLGFGLFDFPQSPAIGFGVPGKPQIGLTIGDVTRTGRKGTFRIGAGTELEAIAGVGTVFTDIKKVGVTTIKGQKVELIEFKVRKATIEDVGKVKTKSVTTEGLTRVSGEVVTSSLATITRPSAPKLQTTTISLPKSQKITTQTLPKTIKTKPLTITTPPISTSQLTKVTRAKSPPLTIPTPTITRPTAPITKPTFPTTPPPTPPPKIRKLPRGIKTPKVFTVEVRRRGRFRPVATTKDLRRAVSIGVGRVATTLGATFRIRGAKVGVATPPGFRRSGDLFIERKEFRLSRIGEVREIQRAKKRKKKK